MENRINILVLESEARASCCLLSLGSSLGWQCETIVEEYEDELIEFFSREADNVKDKLCSKRTGKLLPRYLWSSQLCGIRHMP